MTPDEFKRRRKALGITQQDLAEMWGHDTRTIRRWESQDSEIPTLAIWGIKMLEITSPHLNFTGAE
jgi:DNA-binding transcriptional regulator YiaG